MKAELRCLLPFLLLAGCAVGPDYREVEPTAPNRWQAAPSTDERFAKAGPQDLNGWWKTLEDPGLNRLMAMALAGNLDAGIALARIEQARALRSGARAELFPNLGARTGVQRQDNPFPGLAPGIRYNLFDVGFDAVWEADLFGRLQRRLESASAEFDAAREQYSQVLVVLSADLARNYIEYRNQQHLLEITRSNLDSMRRTLDLTEKMYREGVAARHDVVRARAQAEATEARLPALEADRVASLRRLEALIGKPPGALDGVLAEAAPIPAGTGRILLTSPADTLRHRPDLRAAERRLAAATARQGEAFAELFPKISLSAFLGLRNTSLDSLFSSAAFSYGAAANLVQPLLNFGRIQAGIDFADAQQQEAYLIYERSVLEALRDTETAISRYLNEEIRRQTLSRSVADQQESVRLSQLRYSEGVSSFLDVLDAQRALYAVESELAVSQAATAIDLIAVYKSLGGRSA